MVKTPGFLLCLIIVCGLTLSGCNPLVQPSPDEVMQKVNLGLADLRSVQYDLVLKLNGPIQSNLLKDIQAARIHLDGHISSQATGLPEYDLAAEVTATNPQAAVSIRGNLVSLSDFTYFQLTDLAAPSLLPVTLGVDKKWYRIPTQTTISPPTEISQADGQETVDQLLISSKPLSVTEVLPVTTINGKRAYHYRAKIDTNELTRLLEGLALLVDNNINLPSMDHLSLYEPEIFVSTRTHELVGIRLAGEQPAVAGPVEFELQITLAEHNQKHAIAPPSASENIDSGKIFGLPKLPF